MMLLKQVTIDAIYRHTQSGAEKALPPGRTYGKVWDVCTPVGPDTELPKSKFFKSITSDIADDIVKKKNFFDLVLGIFNASNFDNFREFYSESTTHFKEAHAFDYGGHKIKIHEVKNLRKKERLYIYCGELFGKKRCVLLLAIHKKDENTPDSVKNYCEDQVKAFFKHQQGKS